MATCYEYCHTTAKWCIGASKRTKWVGQVAKPCGGSIDTIFKSPDQAAAVPTTCSCSGCSGGAAAPAATPPAAPSSPVAGTAVPELMTPQGEATDRMNRAQFESFFSYFRSRPIFANSYQASSEPDDDLFNPRTGRPGVFDDQTARVPVWSGNPALRRA